MADQPGQGGPLLEPVRLEQDQRLSRSLLWQMQRAFYEQQGVEAWSRGFVPFYITNNPWIAASYAQVVLGYLRDCQAPTPGETTIQIPKIDPSQPVYIVELGAGSGRFAFHFLRRLVEMLEQSWLRDIRVTYVLTDISDRSLAFWRSHPRLRPFVQAGQLDFAVYDPANDLQIHLMESGIHLRPGELANPLVVLANYFFDSIPQDVFSIANGMLAEGLVSLASTRQATGMGDPQLLSYLRVSFRTRFAPVDYYDDADYNQVLRTYLQALNNTYVQFPVGALDVLRNLCAISNRRLLLITGDRGPFRLDALRGQPEPEINLHGSCVSMQVNFHALAQYIRLQGGQAYHSARREEGLVISTFQLGSLVGATGETLLAFHDHVENAGPDDFFQMKKAVENHYGQFTLDQALAFLRMSGYDGTVFANCYPALLRLAKDATPAQCEFLQEAAGRVLDSYYAIGEAFDLPVAVARLYMAISSYPEALDCLRQSAAAREMTPEIQSLIDTCRQYVWEPIETPD